MENRSSPEFKELISHLIKSFRAGDVKGTGEVNSANFDNMMEKTSMHVKNSRFATDAVREKGTFRVMGVSPIFYLSYSLRVRLQDLTLEMERN